MADLNELYGENTSSLDELVPDDGPVATAFPVSAVRNRAATTAFLAPTSEDGMKNYDAIMQENMAGEDGYVKTLQSNIQAETHQQDMKGVLSILSDPTVGIEQKDAVVKAFRDNQTVRDSSSILAENAIIAPSSGESLEEEAVRLNTSDMLREMDESRQVTQGLVNAAALSRKGSLMSKVPQALETMLLPGGQGALTAQITSGQGGSFLDIIRSAALPGSTITDLREKLAAMTPQQRMAFTQELIPVIQNSDNLLFTKDNDYAALEKLQQIFGDEYDNTDKWLDNITNVLDIVGMGAAARAGAKALRGGKAAKAVEGAVDTQATAKGVERAVDAPGTPVGPLAQMPEARIPANSSALSKVEAEYADTIAAVQSRLDPGEVTSLRQELESINAQLSERTSVRNGRQAQGLVEQKTDLRNRKAAVENRLNINAASEQAQARLPGLEKQMEKLRKDSSTVSAPLNPIMDALKRIDINSVVKVENPASPGQILMQTNPERARNVHYMVYASEGDEVSQAVYGTSRADALASGTYPQAVTSSGKVTTKPVDMDMSIRSKMIEDSEDIIRDSGGIEFTPKELASARANVVNDFQNANGMVVNNAMSNFAFDGTNIKIGAVYGTPNGGWLNAEDAVQQAMYSLRGYGIRADELTVLQKQGLDHVPVKLDDVKGKQGNYLVQVDSRIGVDASNVSEWEELAVKRNVFDYLPPIGKDSAGSANRWLFDAASSLDKTITGAAVNAADRVSLLEKNMLTHFANYADKFNKLDKERKAKMTEYFKEANFKRLKADPLDLQARGFTPNEQNIVSDWRSYWDGVFHLENLDVVRSLRRDGYQKFTNSNADLVVKPAPKNINNSRVYDPASDTHVTLSKKEMDDLYDSGGTIGQLRRPTDLGGETAEHMIIRNTPTEYARAFRDDDRALNYIDGYFQVTYNAPKFVDEVVRGANGVVTSRRAVAVAGDTKEAQFFAKRQKVSTGLDYEIRGDERALRRDSDSYWDVNAASGRIAQRHRGKLLEDSSGLNHLGDSSYIDNPVNSGIRAAMSVSGRTINRPMLDAAKERFLQQYADILPLNEFQQPRFPKDRREIRMKGKDTGGKLADARTTYEYIRYLEQGYINSVDNVVKAAFNAIGDGLGSVGLSKLERGANTIAAGPGISSLSKAGVFNAYIATNPLRQWIVQTHQGVRSMAYNPVGWANGGVQRYAAGYLGDAAGINNPSKAVQEFIDFFKSTGMADSIDKSNLVRGTLSDAAGRNSVIGRIVRPPLDALRKVGFDIGEAGNLIVHASAVFEKYKRAGENITDAAVRARMHSEIRAITWDMNFAGDMPYNQNWAAVALQFMQVPHKAMLQLTNRRIDHAARLRMVGADMVLWGLPGVTIASQFLGGDILPDEPDLREAMVSGLESVAMNHLLRTIGNDNTSIDFSSLAPYDMGGWADFFSAVWGDREGGLKGVLANAPAGQLFLKDGGRLSSAIGMAAKFFTHTEDDLGDVPTLLDVGNEIAKLSSGWNNWQKGSAMLELSQARDGLGRITDEQTTKFEAIAQILGFGTTDTKDFYDTNIRLSKSSKERKDRATKDAEDILRLYQTLNPENPDQVAKIQKVSSVILRKYKADPEAQAVMQGVFNKALATPELGIATNILRSVGMPNPGELNDTIRMAPISEERKKQLQQIVKDAQNIRSNNDIFKEE